jgi:hypothetical protein
VKSNSAIDYGLTSESVSRRVIIFMIKIRLHKDRVKITSFTYNFERIQLTENKDKWIQLGLERSRSEMLVRCF